MIYNVQYVNVKSLRMTDNGWQQRTMEKKLIRNGHNNTIHFIRKNLTELQFLNSAQVNHALNNISATYSLSLN